MEWHIYVDGASSGNPGESGAGIVIYEKEKEISRHSIYLGKMTNNMAEYEALIFALQKARDASISRVNIYTDSLLVSNQVSGIYKTKNPVLKAYLNIVKKISRNFSQFSLKYIPREKNRIADGLAKAAIKYRGRQVTAPHSGEESPGIKGQDGP